MISTSVDDYCREEAVVQLEPSPSQPVVIWQVVEGQVHRNGKAPLCPSENADVGDEPSGC